jgi:hypothetical protein
MKNKKNIFRQGDVLLVPVKEIPSGLVQTKKVTLALGEVTGHHHTIFEGAIGYAESPDALVSFLEVTDNTADLTHQEHSTISIPSGKYKNVIQVEYTPESIQKVRD